jgi:Txe/YoeB family toxin of toxin-antitoxin system
MSEWTVVYARLAEKDWEKVKRSNLRERVLELIAILRVDPFATQPSFEALVGERAGAYSRRINVQHRLDHEVSVSRRMVKVLSMWSRYE